jgi:hypothetical protein
MHINELQTVFEILNATNPKLSTVSSQKMKETKPKCEKDITLKS